MSKIYSKKILDSDLCLFSNLRHRPLMIYRTSTWLLRFKMLYILHQDVSTGFERAPVSARALPRNAGWGGETPGCSVRCPRFPSRAKQMKEAAEGFLHHSKGATGKACDLK